MKWKVIFRGCLTSTYPRTVNQLINISKLGAIATVLLLAACKKQDCSGDAPILSHDTIYYSIIDGAKTAFIESKFEDCQGDIGTNDEGDTTRVHTFLYEFYDSEWHRFYHPDSADSILFFSTIPGSDKLKEDERVEGTLIQKIPNAKQNSDTLRFEIYIIDQAGNRSNRITTPRLIIP